MKQNTMYMLSKYPPDIIGFCETIFHENISNDSLNINGLYKRERIEQKIAVVVG
jgi:hypothetical protein